MDKYRLEGNTRDLIEASRIPFAVYQFLERRVVTLALSQGFCDLFGFVDRDEACELMDNDMYRDAHPDDAARIADVALRFGAEGGDYDTVYRTKAPGSSEYMIVHAHGEHILTPTNERLAVVWYTDEGTYAEGRFAFAAGRRDALNRTFGRLLHEESALRDSFYDLLTGLPNMSYFFDLAEAGREGMHARGQDSAVLYFDLSGMKAFNTKHGFAEGDKLLRAVAKVLVGEFSNENCGRFGQDHFAVYTRADGLEGRLQRVFGECRAANGGVSLPVKTGIYLDAFEPVDISTACDRAKMACDLNRKIYASAWRYFDESLMEHEANRSYILDNLDAAIENRWIRPHYQGIVRAATGDICGDEALARWVDPERGMLSPGQFIPVLEEAGLLHKLDMHMVDCVLSDLRERMEWGLSLVPVSVNISLGDLGEVDLARTLAEKADAAGISHGLLHVEFTESVASSDPGYLKSQIEALHAAGFGVWMDDFGSGYSSLNSLKDFDFYVVKLDMDFIRGSRGEKARAIVAGVIQIAHDLGMGTLAEGVETEEQARYLESVGCEMLQGYFYSLANSMEVIKGRFDKGTLMRREKLAEASYWDAIGDFDLLHPSADLQGIGVDGMPTVRPPAGVLECRDGQWRILRANPSFREFLDRTGLLPAERSPLEANPVEGAMDDEFFALVSRGVTAGNWEHIGGPLEYGTGFQFYVRLLSSVPNAQAYAIASVPTMLGSALGLYGDVPVAYAVFRVLLDEARSEVVNTEYVYANPMYCEWLDVESGSLTGKLFLDAVDGADSVWFPYCYRAAVLGESVHDTLYSRELGHWLSFSVAPTSVEGCCVFAFTMVDDERREQEEVQVGRDTSDFVLEIAKVLIGDSDYEGAMNASLEMMSQVIHPERLYVFEMGESKTDNTFEWCAEGVEPEIDTLQNLDNSEFDTWARLMADGSLVVIPDVEATREIDMQMYETLARQGITHLLAVPFYGFDGKLIGYLGADNYLFEEGYDTARLLKGVSTFMGARIARHRMLGEIEGMRGDPS